MLVTYNDQYVTQEIRKLLKLHQQFFFNEILFIEIHLEMIATMEAENHLLQVLRLLNDDKFSSSTNVLL